MDVGDVGDHLVQSELPTACSIYEKVYVDYNFYVYPRSIF